MTLREYLYIENETFILEFEDFWYYHNPKQNILINIKTKECWKNLFNLEHHTPLSEYFNFDLESKSLDYRLEIYSDDIRFYIEGIAMLDEAPIDKRKETINKMWAVKPVLIRDSNLFRLTATYHKEI